MICFIYHWHFVSVKQSKTQGRGKERKGDTMAIAGSLEHCSFAFAGKQINERYGIPLHQQTCAGEVEFKHSAGLLWTACIQVPNIIHSPTTAGGLFPEVLYGSDQLGVHSRQKGFFPYSVRRFLKIHKDVIQVPIIQSHEVYELFCCNERCT